MQNQQAEGEAYDSLFDAAVDAFDSICASSLMATFVIYSRANLQIHALFGVCLWLSRRS